MSNLLLKNKTALTKTASYYVVHIVVAALVAWAVTGSLVVALTLSFLEPTFQAIAYFIHEKAWARGSALKYAIWAKTGTYYVMHILVAAAVAYSVTGDVMMALTLSLLEPTVQMVVFYFHEKIWNKRLAPTLTAA